MPNESKKQIKRAVKRAVKRVVKKRRPIAGRMRRPLRQRRAARPRTRGSGRVLMPGSRITPARFTCSGSNERLRLTGSEIISKVVCTQVATATSWTVNPRNAELFPRLQGFAFQFERYRFKRLGLRFVSDAPATRSGGVALAVHTNWRPGEPVPLDVANFCSFGFAKYGSVGQPVIATPVWNNDDPKRFYLDGDSISGELNLTQASLHTLTVDSSEADDYEHAGYLYLDYDLELFSVKPTSQLMITQQGASLTTYNERLNNTGVAATQSRLLDFAATNADDFDVSLKTTGHFGLDDGADLWDGTWAAGQFSVDDQAKSVVQQLMPGSWNYRTSYSLSAAAGPSPDSKSDSKVGRDYVRVLHPLVETDVVLYNPAFVKMPKTGWMPMTPEEVKLGKAGPEAYHDRLQEIGPAIAAGDLISSFYGVDNKNQELVPIYVANKSGIGTGAYTGQDSFAFSVGQQALNLIHYLYPATVGEYRDINSTSAGPLAILRSIASIGELLV